MLRRIETSLATEVTQQSFSALEKELTAVFSPADEPDNGDVDSIANLALLDHRDNTALEQLGVRGQAARDPSAGQRRAPTSRRAPVTSSSSTTPRRATSSSTSGAAPIGTPTSQPSRRRSQPYLQPEEVDA